MEGEEKEKEKEKEKAEDKAEEKAKEVEVEKVEKPVETTESFETLEEAYPLAATTEIKDDKNVDHFRKEHCKKGHVIHKGQIVKPEMVQHVYPNIVQSDVNKCNICDPSCDFQITDKRIVDESDLTNPKSSNDMFEKVWTNLRTTTEKMMNPTKQ